MAREFDLHHWDNSYFKTLLIVTLCTFKNEIFIVYDNSIPVATFQIRKFNNQLIFQKLATVPLYEKKGIGSFCLNKIELLGKEKNCSEVICEVYEKSLHAKSFYENRGFFLYGNKSTRKYNELLFKKMI